MSTIQNCPRCHGSIEASDRVCPRCGLVLSSRIAQAVQADTSAQAISAPSADPEPLPRQTGSLSSSALPPVPAPPRIPPVAQAGPVGSNSAASLAQPRAGVGPLKGATPTTGSLSRYAGNNTGPLSPARVPNGTGPLQTNAELNTTFLSSTGSTGPLLHTGPLRTGPFDRSILAGGEARAPGDTAPGASRPVPRGALELLPQEEVAFQLGALYLTTKRVILLAPSVIRSAFIRDIDAVGTYTERASGWYLFSGVLALAFGAGCVYLSLGKDNPALHDLFPFVYYIDPLFFALALLVLAVALLARYFMHVKRTLFVSVKGRPLITVSIADWNTRKLDGMDAFVNAFFQIKDYLTGEIGDRYNG